MGKMTKLLYSLIGTWLVSYPCFATANQTEVVIGVDLDTQYGFVAQKKAFRVLNPSINGSRKIIQSGIVNNTTVNIRVQSKDRSGITYGALIALNGDTYRDPEDDGVADKAYVFVESQRAGKVEVGGVHVVTRSMALVGGSASVAAFGGTGMAAKWFSKYSIDGTKYTDHFIRWSELPIIRNATIPNSNSINYYSPKLGHFRFGGSYTPDSVLKGSTFAFKNTKSSENRAFKNVVDVAVQYAQQVGEVNAAVAFVGQYGKAKSFNIKRNDAAAWEIGTKLKYRDFSLAGSYSDWGKTGTPKVREPGKKYGAGYWTLGASYAPGPVRASVVYFNGYRANVFIDKELTDTTIFDAGYNKNQYLSFGLDYVAVKGFTPYFEVTQFEAKRYGVTQHNKGYVTLLGTRISF